MYALLHLVLNIHYIASNIREAINYEEMIALDMHAYI